MIFIDIVTANACLDLQDRADRVVIYTIDNKNRRSKEVITCWDGSLPDLGETLDDKDQILSIEQLRKRVYDDKKKVFDWEPTKHSIITMKGNILPRELTIYGKVTIIPVKSFVEPVLQCFQCYGYGHWKDKCKKAKNVWYVKRRSTVCAINRLDV